MAFTSTLTTEAEVTAKEGANVSGSVTEAMHNAWVQQAETFVCAATRYNWIDDYGSLNVDVKYILSDLVSSLIAINGIMYDPSGYTSLAEAESKVTVLRDGILRNLSLLRDKKVQDFINGA